MFNSFLLKKNLYSSLVNQSRLVHLESIPMKLPFWGNWTITQGINGEHTHKDAWKYAWDFEITDDKGEKYKNNGNQLNRLLLFWKARFSSGKRLCSGHHQ